MADVLGFVFCCVVIFIAGKKLSYYGDQLAIRKGWAKAWVGLILLSTVTSLPELVVGISSSAIIKSADLAVGNIIGSCAFNIFILALLDVFVPGRKSLLALASQSQIMASAMGIILLSMVGAGIFLPDQIYLIPGIGLMSVLFIVIYLLSVRLIFYYELKIKPGSASVGKIKTVSRFSTTLWMFILFAVIIIVAALFLPLFADNLALRTGISKTFIGTFLLAMSTSLPELSVSVAAVRMGSIDLSIGNLLGSNLFNIFILAVNDFFYIPGHILKDASDLHIFSILATIVMTAIAIIGLTYRIEKKRFHLGWDTFLIISVYILNVLILFAIS